MLQGVRMAHLRNILDSPRFIFRDITLSMLFEGNPTVWKVQYNIEME
jgi:hypothetical protein